MDVLFQANIGIGVNLMEKSKIIEFGGFLPIDSSFQPFYKENTFQQILELNLARNAIIEAFRDSNWDTLWLPIYTCKSVFDAVKKAGIKYRSYNIKENFLPDIKHLPENHGILITNYYGIFDEKRYEQFLELYSNIIFDNTQSFYQRPVRKKHVYNVYSPRKFFGVTDGAYLICERFNYSHTYKKDYSFNRAEYLFQSTEKGTNAVYDSYLKAENELSESAPLEMSELTKSLLGRIDYESVQRKRNHNFSILAKKLSRYNGLSISINSVSPMVYPLLIDTPKKNFRKYLVENKLYIPQWWKWVLDNPQSNSFEKKLSQHLYPLPIDQRYNEEDMKCMIEIVVGGLEN